MFMFHKKGNQFLLHKWHQLYNMCMTQTSSYMEIALEHQYTKINANNK